jgi:hypothetical protein
MSAVVVSCFEGWHGMIREEEALGPRGEDV